MPAHARAPARTVVRNEEEIMDASSVTRTPPARHVLMNGVSAMPKLGEPTTISRFNKFVYAGSDREQD